MLGSIGGPGVGLGLGLLGNILGTRSERNRLEKMRAELETSLNPVEANLQGKQFGPSQSEGRVTQGITQSTLSDLSNRGVLDSSFAAPQVAQAVAPLELQRQQDIQQGTRDLAAARMQVKGATSLPGYGEAFGQTLGDFGELAALQAGRSEGRKRAQGRQRDRIRGQIEQPEILL